MKLKTLLATLVAGLGLATMSSAALAQSATYQIDPTHTSIIWEAKHFGTSTSRGRFDKKSGMITLDKAGKSGKADITIDMTSINTGVGPFDNHLKSPDFFAAEKFPEAKFSGTEFKFNGDKLSEVVGTLTLRGITQPATLKATGFGCYDHPMLKREVCGGDFETTIARSQFDVKYGLPGIPDNIRLLIQVEAVKQ
jgi:polyisoprenoid-binding protein YceI